MQNNNIPYIQLGSFIKMQSDILPIFICEQATKDTINIITYILNDLNLLYNNQGQLLEEKTYVLTQGEVINMLHYDAINKKKQITRPREKVNGKWVYKQVITVLQELIHRINGLILLTDNGMKYTPLASSIEFVESKDTYLVTIKLNPQFLEVYNQLLQAGEGYYQILSDILVSLPDMKSQILWALICQYRYQLKTHGQTNPRYLKSLREYMAFAGVPKKMSNQHFIEAMNTSMNKINRLILERNKELSDDKKEATYKIEFIKESVMKQPNRNLAQYEKYQIVVDEEPPKTKPTPKPKSKQSKPKNTPKTKSRESNTIIEDKDWKAWR